MTDLELPRRVFIVGTSGSGKTTLSQDLARILGVQWIPIDQIAASEGWHQWRQRPRAPLERRIRELGEQMDAEPSGWVADGGYLWWTKKAVDEADAIIWLDLPWWITLPRIGRRMIRTYFQRLRGSSGLQRIKVLVRPGASELLFNIVETWRIRPKGRGDPPESAARLSPPGDDLDEVSLDSFELLCQVHSEKSLRLTQSLGAAEVLRQIQERRRA